MFTRSLYSIRNNLPCSLNGIPTPLPRLLSLFSSTLPRSDESFSSFLLTSSIRTGRRCFSVVQQEARRRTMTTEASTPIPTVLVVGGNGALGESVLSSYRNAGWKTYSVGFHDNPHADVSIKFPVHATLDQQLSTIQSTLTSSSSSSSSSVPFVFSTIICTAGGWTGGTIAQDDFIKGYHTMHQMCMDSALVSAKLSTKYLASKGLLILIGSAAGINPQPSMLAYGLQKNSTHYLTLSLSNTEQSGLPSRSRVICVLPRTLDTPNNRKYMGGPNVDTSSWTPTDHISERCVQWSTYILKNKEEEENDIVPSSGSLLIANTTKGNTVFEEVIIESKSTGKLY